MGIIRKAHSSNFTVVTNALAQNNDLSFEARGLLLYLLSKPDDWKAFSKDIEREGNIGRDKRIRLFKELEKAGYCKRIRRQSHKGLIEVETLIFEEPIPKEDRSYLGKPELPLMFF